jgi:hydrophobic/amphiphilic exporter-1 (mainly G- bacteria), HAE1 family
MSITQIAIKRSTLVVVIFSVLGILGFYSYTMLKYELFPKMDMPVVVLMTQYPGASANEVESNVTKNIEDALSSLENVKYMKSTSSEGVSLIIMELQAGTNINIAAQDAQRKVNAVQYQLPDAAKTPALFTFSMDDLPILKLGVSGKMPPTKLYKLTDDVIKSRLSKVDGVGQVTLLGGNQREIKINILKGKLDAYKISIAQVYAAISNANLEYPTGKIEGDLREYTVRLAGKVTSLDMLRNITITKNANGSVVKLNDIAEIVDGTTKQITISRINGEDAIGIQIQKQSDANAVKVAELVKQEMKAIESTYADANVKFSIASDNSTYTLASAHAVMEDLSIAIILVAIVMLLFLHSIRNSFIVLISIPASIVSVFIAMYVFDFSLNMLTLMALSLVIGILVDDSIVVLENIYRHLQMGKHRAVAALDGRTEIGFTAVAITMVDVVVFLPLSMVSGMIGNMLREFSLVVVFSTLMSLFVSFTITPLLASRFSKIERLTRGSFLGKIACGFEDFYKQLLVFYERALRWALQHKKIVYITITLLVISSFSLIGFGFIGSEFIATGDRGEFIIKLEGEPQNSLQQTNRLVQQVEKILSSKPEVEKIFSNVGYSSVGLGSTSEQHKAEITVTLVNKKKRNISVEDYSVMIKKELSGIAGLKVTTAPVSMMGTADQAPVQILVRSPDMNKIYKTADEITKIMQEVKGTSDITLSVEKSNPEIQINLNRDKMGILGLSVADVGKTLQLAFAGTTDLLYSEGSDDYNINVQFDKFDRKSVEDVGAITFLNNNGQIIELRQFADIYQALGPSKLERYNRMSSLTVNANVFGRPVGTVGEEIQNLVKSRIHDNDVSIEYKGQLERQAEAFGSLFTALFAGLLLIYAIMVALYNSYLYPFVVLFSIPVAIIGALLALALAGENLSIFSIVGMIMLLGLVAKNAILIVDFTNKLREDGKSVVEALVEAGKERLRPILMTTLAMVFGMLPIATATGEASEIKNGLAWVIIGGLTSSLIFTLLLVPSVYMSLENVKLKLHLKFAKNKVVAAEPVASNEA